MYILDTHTWIWYITESEKLSKKARLLIDESQNSGISVISCWELAMLVNKNRIKFKMELEEWMNLALLNDKIKVFPLSPQIAILSSKLSPTFHGDPADRLIVSTAIKNELKLITKDKKIIDSKIIETIW